MKKGGKPIIYWGNTGLGLIVFLLSVLALGLSWIWAWVLACLPCFPEVKVCL